MKYDHDTKEELLRDKVATNGRRARVQQGKGILADNEAPIRNRYLKYAKPLDFMAEPWCGLGVHRKVTKRGNTVLKRQALCHYLPGQTFSTCPPHDKPRMPEVPPDDKAL